MCGIAVIRATGADGEVEHMLNRLHHRGPDDSKWRPVSDGRCTVGHDRLAIMDPAGGHQPLVDPSGAVAVANCEIYNHHHLRRDFSGTELQSGSDTAVLLPLFRRHGSDLVDLLDGMFAFVVVDDGGNIVAARDRIGIKPLYRGVRGDEVAFASEVKALLDGGWTDIEAVPPGHVQEGGAIRRFYEVPQPAIGAPVDETAIGLWTQRLREALERAVVKRLMSDVPLGAFLSGGIDSSIVTALAARHKPGLSTFSLGFPGSEDLEAARMVADHLGTDHHEIVVPEDELVDVLPEVLYHLESWDRDLVRSAVPTYLVARFAASQLKVVLAGEGADELFGGYRYHSSYVDDPDTLQRELHRSVTAMHDSNLQRLDRMTMAHSLEARVPFLDPDVVEVAMQIPAELKIRRGRDGVPVEKWILRHAFAHLLPPEIVSRTKSQFDEGSGAVDRLPGLADSAMDGAVPDMSGARVRDVEEGWYFSQVRASLGDWRAIQDNTSAWNQGRLVPG